MSEQFKLKLFETACGLTSSNYTVENNGEFDKIDKDKMRFTPENIKAVYDQLVDLFSKEFTPA